MKIQVGSEYSVGVRRGATVALALVAFGLGSLPRQASAFYEDVCVTGPGTFDSCISAASAQKSGPGRSTIHMDATYFLAQAIGFRADVAYWIAAYDEVTDLAAYAPFDSCGTFATPQNSGAKYIAASFNGFARDNMASGGSVYHYVSAFSPAGNGSDVFRRGGPQGLYPFRFPSPGYPQIDTVYEGTLAAFRGWALQAADTGILCSAGFTVPNGSSNFTGSSCLSGTTISGLVPVFGATGAGAPVRFTSGLMPLDTDANGNPVAYVSDLGSYLSNPQKTTGVLWLDPVPTKTVPVPVARFGLYLHSLQDRASHSTYCGDDAPGQRGTDDPGTYIAKQGPSTIHLTYGTGCAQQYHLLGHTQETATGDVALPLRDYTALNVTLNELVVFANTFGKGAGLLSNPELLPPDVVSGKNAQGMTATAIASETVGKIVKGVAYSGAESYVSGAVTLPLQKVAAKDRMNAMAAAVASYSSTVKARSASPSTFVAFSPLPGTSADAADTSVCFR